MTYWNGKVVVVTGGSAGLGRAIADALAKAGAKVVIAARGAEQLEQARQELSASGEVGSFAADVTDPEQASALIVEAVRRHGRLDVLVNNVGRSTRGRAVEVTPEMFRESLETNFLSAVHCTRAAAEHLIAARGHLVNIGSLAGKTVSPHLGAYPASKFALSAYSQQLRLELAADGVHVLLVCPGPIAREDAGRRYDAESNELPSAARRPGGGVKLKGIDPDKLAAKILRACERRRPELIVPGKARLLLAIAALSPRLGEAIIRRMTAGGEG